jgi:hypothetical protein
MSLIVDINPVPWEILDLVRARILKNRANRQKRQPEKPGELRRVMQVDNGILAKQRWEEPSFIASEPIFRISVAFDWNRYPGYVSSPATTIGGNEPAFIGKEPYSGLGGDAIHVRVDRVNNDYPGLAAYKVFLVPSKLFSVYPKELTTVSVYAFTEALWIELGQSGPTIDRANEILAETLIFKGSPGQMGTLEIQLNGSGATLT